ncbi:MAG: 50S ribosomal protein L1 [Chloroflexi bacterium]|nr:50S ribosomal protein L1 [Chloroflexota bacterium]
MPKHGKRYRALAEQVDRDKFYSIDEAVGLLKQVATAKFNETIEVHLRLGIDPRHADQQVRSTAVLPHGSGKVVRVLVFAEGEAARLAREAGADYIGSDDLIAQIQGGWLEFDVTLATPDIMRKVSGLGRVLGRRGLMPNPKSGTLVPRAEDLPRVIQEVKGGRVEFRNDRTGLLHVGVGKISFSEDQIRDNVLALVDAVQRAKPSGAKGIYTRSITLTSTMAPGIRLDVAPTIAASAAS